MKSFEDLGYYCLDNLPPNLSMALVALVEQGGIHRTAPSAIRSRRSTASPRRVSVPNCFF
jgi:RNase adaptor protein for sRNA GlmZ degradation